MEKPQREIYCADAIDWFKKTPILPNSSIVASMPDISEFPGYSLSDWKKWFEETATLILSRCPEDGVVLFYQSDIKVDGRWVDKGYLCQKAAEAAGVELLFHKILCRFPAGTITFGRPAYTHLLCFSRSLKLDPGKSTPDVLPDLGDKTWERGMGLDACVLIARFLTRETSTKTLIHPFCGEGSMLAAANAFGLNAIGIERSPKRVEKARSLMLSHDFESWQNE
jgi:hypothetical protein